MTSIAYGLLWLFVFSVPWERILVLPGVAIVSRVTGGVALALTLAAVIMTGRFRRWHMVHMAALLFWIWAGANLLIFHGGERFPAKYWTYGQLLLVFWMIWEAAQTESRARGLMMAYVFGAYVAALDTLFIYRSHAGALRRYAAGGADPNDLAMVLALAIPMAWYLGMTARKPLTQWICRAYLPLGVLAVGLSGSRGGMATATLALLIVPLSMVRLSPGRLVSAMVMLTIAGGLAVAYVPETIVERLSTIGTELEGGRIGGRGKLWVAGLEAFVYHPIGGYGTGLFKGAITPLLGGAAQVAHNSYISVLVEQGIVGFVLYMTMVLGVLRSVFKLPQLERRFGLVLMGTLGMAMLPLTWEDRRAVWTVLALVLVFSQSYLARPSSVVWEPVADPSRQVPVRSRFSRRRPREIPDVTT